MASVSISPGVTSGRSDRRRTIGNPAPHTQTHPSASAPPPPDDDSSVNALTFGGPNPTAQTLNTPSFESMRARIEERKSKLSAKAPGLRTELESQRVYRRLENINWLEGFAALHGLYIDKVEGWWHLGKPNGIDSEFDTIILKGSDVNNSVTITIKLDSCVSCQSRGLLTRYNPNYVNIHPDNWGRVVSYQGITHYNNKIYSQGRIVSDAPSIDDFLSPDNLNKHYPVIQNTDDEKPPIHRYTLEAIAYIQSSFKEIYADVSGKQSHALKVAQGLRKISQVPPNTRVRNQDASWRRLESGQIELTSNTGKLTNNGYINFLYTEFEHKRAPFPIDRLVQVHTKDDTKPDLTENPVLMQRVSFATANIIQSQRAGNRALVLRPGTYPHIPELLAFRLARAILTPTISSSIKDLKALVVAYNTTESQNDTEFEPLDPKEIITGFMQHLVDIDIICKDLGITPPHTADIPENFPKITYYPPKTYLVPNLALPDLTLIQSRRSLSELVDDFKFLNVNILKRLDQIEHIEPVLASITNWWDTLSHYQSPELHKRMMVIEYILALIDKIDAYELKHNLSYERYAAIMILKKVVMFTLAPLSNDPNAPELKPFRFAFLNTLHHAVAFLQETWLTAHGMRDMEMDAYLHNYTVANELDPTKEDDLRFLEKSRPTAHSTRQEGFQRNKTPFHLTLYTPAIVLTLISGHGIEKTDLIHLLSGENESRTRSAFSINDNTVHVLGNSYLNETSENQEPRTETCQILIKKDFTDAFQYQTQTISISDTDKDSLSMPKAPPKSLCDQISQFDRNERSTNHLILCPSEASSPEQLLDIAYSRSYGRVFINHAISTLNAYEIYWKDITYKLRILEGIFNDVAGRDSDESIDDIDLEQLELSEEKNTKIKAILNKYHHASEAEKARLIPGLKKQAIHTLYAGHIKYQMAQELSSSTHLHISKLGPELQRPIDNQSFSSLSQFINAHPAITVTENDATGIQDSSEEHLRDMITGEIEPNETRFLNHSDIGKPKPLPPLPAEYKNETIIQKADQTDADKIAFLESLIANGSSAKILRAEGHIHINGKWFFYSLANGYIFRIQEQHLIRGQWHSEAPVFTKNLKPYFRSKQPQENADNIDAPGPASATHTRTTHRSEGQPSISVIDFGDYV